MFKVLFIESGSGYGGSARCLKLLLEHIDKEKIEPIILYYRSGPSIEDIRNSGFRAKKHSVFALICAILRSDVVYINNEIYSHFLNIILAKLFTKKVICHMRGIRPLTRGERLLSGWVSKFISVSNICKDNLVSNGILQNSIEVIYDGAEQSEDRKYIRNNPVVRVGVVGRISQGKGQDIFIKAAKEVLLKHEGIKFCIVGDDPQCGKPALNNLRNLVRLHSLDQAVFFSGWETDLEKIYEGLDIVVCPSLLKEALGNVVIEAMTFARPIIASDSGAYPEMIEDEKNGLLFKAGDVSDLTEKILRLLEDKSLRQALAQEARRTAEEKFDIKKNVARIERAIEDVAR